MMPLKITLIITIFGDDGDLHQLLTQVKKQELIPDEVIIINSLREVDIHNIIKKFSDYLNIRYFFKDTRLMPGAARNFGVQQSSYPLIAFLDSKTLPNKEWLCSALKDWNGSKRSIVFGSTSYIAHTEFQKIVILSTYGKNAASSIPGTLITQELFKEIGFFSENVRAGEDIEWRNRAYGHDNVIIIIPKNSTLIYDSVSTNIFSELYRSARNNWSAASIDAQLNTRALFLALVSSFLLLITPNWNRFLGGIFFIPNITKIYFIFFSISVILVYLIRPKKIRVLIQNLFLPMLFTFLILTIAFPEALQMAATHTIGEKFLISIGPFFITSLLTIGFIFRAFIAPIRLGANLNDLFPLRWILMGSLGLVNDLFKAPGYLLGACLTVGRIFKRKIYDSF